MQSTAVSLQVNCCYNDTSPVMMAAYLPAPDVVTQLTAELGQAGPDVEILCSHKNVNC